MPAPDAILELVKRFEYNLDAYRSPQYNETRLRREFLDPLFTQLGWDVENKQGCAEAYKDVIHEDAIKIGGTSKAPDYCFRIGGARKFFVEAKKPAVNLHSDTAPAFQLRRYAWSAKLPLSILTDFEEFAVYDCRIQPAQSDKAAIARLQYIGYQDYAARWDDIAAVFSRDAILKGAFDKYAEDKKARRGTAEVDAAFLGEIEQWREALAKNIALRNPELKNRELNLAVQITIDRIIFLRICEDRGIETLGRLQALCNGGAVYERLCVLFREADERYNSGLFHFRMEKGRGDDGLDTLTTRLKIDDKVLKEILVSLYYPAPYAFEVFPADILGQVYEQFLGKVIRLNPRHQAIIEDKPEVKKAGGIYYTPTYSVNYIVEQTVGKLLENKTPKQAAELRILDPACGSGSFLIAAYQKLLDWHQKWYFDDGPEKFAKGKSPALYQGMGDVWRLTTGERKRILLNNIYGVDIDAQAVEVTKLSLLLKVLEGETQESVRTQLSLALGSGRVLPDLDANIQCGNSLIGPDFYTDKEPVLFDEDEMYRVNAFDWKTCFSSILTGDNPGFDAVIGNPPYGACFYEQDKGYINTKYQHQNYQLDSYLLFLERSLKQFLAAGGYFGMIIPNPWLTNLTQTSIRKLVFENTCVCSIVHFDYPVFPKVTVDTEIVILQAAPPQNSQVQVLLITDALQLASKNGISVRLHNQSKWIASQGATVNIFLSLEEEALAKKCLLNGLHLSTITSINVGVKPYQVGKGKPPQTRDDVTKRVFDSAIQIDETWREYLRGGDITRYSIHPAAHKFLKFGGWLAEPRPAAHFNAPMKIIMRQTGDGLIAALDTNQYICLNNMHVLVPSEDFPSAKYLLGLINSRLLNWYYRTLNPEVGEALAEVKKTNVARLPVKNIAVNNPSEISRHDRMVALVETMLHLNKQLPDAAPTTRTVLQRQIESTDRQIDSLVYELYGLTPEEIALVES